MAKKCGVSVSTVSKALNASGKIGFETVKKIKETAQEMGYQSNVIAMALSRKKIEIAVILPNRPPEVMNQFEKGFQTAEEQFHKFGINFTYFRYQPENDIDDIQKILPLLTQQFNGMILIPSFGFDTYSKQMKELNLPTVMLLSGTESYRGIATVTVNAVVVGTIAAQFLKIASKNDQAAIITGRKEYSIHRENIEGFKKTAEKLGLKTVGIFETDDEMQRAYDVTCDLLKQQKDLGGIFVTSYVAPMVCNALNHSGKQTEITVIGVDLFPESVNCLLDRSLDALIFQNQEQQALSAVRILMDYFNGSRKFSDVLVKPELVLSSNVCCYEF